MDFVSDLRLRGKQFIELCAEGAWFHWIAGLLWLLDISHANQNNVVYSNTLLPADSQNSGAKDPWTKGVFNGSIVRDSSTKGAFNACSIVVFLAGLKGFRAVAFDANTVLFDGLDPMVADSEA